MLGTYLPSLLTAVMSVLPSSPSGAHHTSGHCSSFPNITEQIRIVEAATLFALRLSSSSASTTTSSNITGGIVPLGHGTCAAGPAPEVFVWHHRWRGLCETL